MSVPTNSFQFRTCVTSHISDEFTCCQCFHPTRWVFPKRPTHLENLVHKFTEKWRSPHSFSLYFSRFPLTVFVNMLSAIRYGVSLIDMCQTPTLTVKHIPDYSVIFILSLLILGIPLAINFWLELLSLPFRTTFQQKLLWYCKISFLLKLFMADWLFGRRFPLLLNNFIFIGRSVSFPSQNWMYR